MRDSRTIFDVVSGRYSPLRILEENRKMLDLVTGRSSPLRVLEENRKTVDLVTGRSSPWRILEENRKMLDLVGSASSTMTIVRQNSELLDSVLSRGSFVSIVGGESSLARMLEQPSVASMLSSSVMPRFAWQGVLGDLRNEIGDDLYEEAVAEFDAAAEQVESSESETRWIYRLPDLTQASLLVIALQVLDAIGQLLGDITGEDVPSEYRSAVQVLFCLAAFILRYMEAKDSDRYND